jgi:acyl dehydratase
MVAEVDMATLIVDGLDGVRALAGRQLGPGEWLPITQERVSAFADATLDHQWIHIDVERARAESPFGGPIAHGYLTLSLLPHLLGQLVDVTGVKATINYGLNRLRYPAPVRVGSRVRLGVTVAGVEEIRGGLQCQLECTVEVEGGDKPALAAEVLFRYYA